MYRVIIIEDDPMVAVINQNFIKKSPEFQVLAVFKSGIEALPYLSENPNVDLVLLDYYTPGMNGGEFLTQLQTIQCSPAVIMVTSANDTKIIRKLFTQGVIDYLVKPFEYARFKDALDRFILTHALLEEKGHHTLRQEDIDQLVIGKHTSFSSNSVLTKGINESTLQMVRDVFKQNTGVLFTSEQLAERVGLSRITIRRYVSYMMELEEISSAIDYQTGGRPSIMYCYPKS